MDGSVGMYEFVITGKDAALGIFLEEVVLGLQVFRFPAVVCIQKGDQVEPGFFDAPVAGGGYSGIFLANEPDAGIPDFKRFL